MEYDKAEAPTMKAHVRHFLLTGEDIREFSAEHAANVAAGLASLPEFADRRVRYVQVVLQEAGPAEIRVRAAGACVEFDAEGHIRAAAAPEEGARAISGFEYDACVQWALHDMHLAEDPVFH